MDLKTTVKDILHCRWCVLAFLLCLMFMSAGCGEGPLWTRSDPDEVLYGFLIASDSMDTETIWEFLGKNTREKLQASAEEFNKTAPENGKRKPHQMMRTFHVISSTREFKKLETVSSDEQKAVVQIVMHEGEAIPVELIREGKRWAIELPFQTGE